MCVLCASKICHSLLKDTYTYVHYIIIADHLKLVKETFTLLAKIAMDCLICSSHCHGQDGRSHPVHQQAHQAWTYLQAWATCSFCHPVAYQNHQLWKQHRKQQTAVRITLIYILVLINDKSCMVENLSGFCGFWLAAKVFLLINFVVKMGPSCESSTAKVSLHYDH